MGFTTPAFIRKNTPELRKKLEKLGYNHSTDVIEDERFCIATPSVNCNYHVILKEVFDDTNPRIGLMWIKLAHSYTTRECLRV